MAWPKALNPNAVVAELKRKVRNLALKWATNRQLLFGIRAAKYTVDGGARGMREVFRSASWPPRLWA
jgi:hypothetical protein